MIRRRSDSPQRTRKAGPHWFPRPPRTGCAEARQTGDSLPRAGPAEPEADYGFGKRLKAERTAWVQSVAPIWAISPAAWTLVEKSANGSGPWRREAGGGLVA